MVSNARVLGPEFQSAKDITCFVEDLVAHEENELPGLELTEELCGRTGGIGRCLIENHGVEDDPRKTSLAHGVSLRRPSLFANLVPGLLEESVDFVFAHTALLPPLADGGQDLMERLGGCLRALAGANMLC